MDIPKISIIVPIYNVEDYLNICVNSLLEQTLKDIEIILVDDGSPDNCPKICDDYAKKDSRVKVIHKKNEGLGFARNTGLEISTGEFVTFVDSDDFIDPNTYEKVYNIAKEKELDCVFFGCNFYKGNGDILPKRGHNSLTIFKGKENVENFLLEMIGPLPSYPSDVKYMMSVCMAIYSREIIQRNKIFFYSERDFISEDLIFQIDFLTKVLNVGYTPELFYYYRYNPASLTHKYDKNKYLRYKKFLSEIRRRLDVQLLTNNYMLHFKRLKLLYFRNIIFDEYKYGKINKINICKQLKIIRNDIYWEDIFFDYPYHLLPIKHLLFYLFSKYRLYRFIIFLFFIKKINS